MTEQSHQRKRRRDVSLDQDSDLVHAWLSNQALTMTSRRVIPSMLSQRRAMQPVYLGIRRIRGKVFSHRSLHERIGFINDGFADNDDQYPDINHNYVEGVDADLTSSNLIADLFPSLLPSVPSPVDRAPDVAVSNPFQADGVLEHPRLRSEAKPVEVPVDGVINGLIKFRLHQDKEPDESVEMRRPQFLQRYMKSRKPNPTTARGVPYLPPEFGRGLKLDPMDLKLMRFCKPCPKLISLMLNCACFRYLRLLPREDFTAYDEYMAYGRCGYGREKRMCEARALISGS